MSLVGVLGLGGSVEYNLRVTSSDPRMAAGVTGRGTMRLFMVALSAGCSQRSAIDPRPDLVVEDVRLSSDGLMIGQRNVTVWLDLHNEGGDVALVVETDVDVAPDGVLSLATEQGGLAVVGGGERVALALTGTVSPDAQPVDLELVPRVRALDTQTGGSHIARLAHDSWAVTVRDCTPAAQVSSNCDSGDLYWFDGCGNREEIKDGCAGLGCSNGACVTTSACPADMVESAMGCIDQYEATVRENVDCTGQIFGQGEDDYPDGFPDLVESAGCGGTCCSRVVEPPTSTVYACSLGGAIPSRLVTWFQAKRACENAGKSLCTNAEWVAACAAEDTTPTGCNTNSMNLNAPVATGSLTTCEGGTAGLFDISGNMAEWTDSCTGETSNIRGGGYAFIGGLNDDCGSGVLRGTAGTNEQYGFRCCLPL